LHDQPEQLSDSLAGSAIETKHISIQVALQELRVKAPVKGSDVSQNPI
jgi:hypothetical protein